MEWLNDQSARALLLITPSPPGPWRPVGPRATVALPRPTPTDAPSGDAPTPPSARAGK